MNTFLLALRRGLGLHLDEEREIQVHHSDAYFGDEGIDDDFI